MSSTAKMTPAGKTITSDIRFSATVFHSVCPKYLPFRKSAKFFRPTHLLPEKPLSSL